MGGLSYNPRGGRRQWPPRDAESSRHRLRRLSASQAPQGSPLEIGVRRLFDGRLGNGPFGAAAGPVWDRGSPAVGSAAAGTSIPTGLPARLPPCTSALF